MEFDWKNSGNLENALWNTQEITAREVEESFEDPFAIKLLPDGDYGQEEARYVCLGKSLQNKALFSIFWTNGKLFRIIMVREMADAERTFYERKMAESLF